MLRPFAITAIAIVLSAPAFADTKTYNLSGFTKIDADAAFEIEFTQSPTFSVVVDSEPNNLDKIIVEKSGDTLVIRRPPNTSIRGRVHDVVRISAPDLEALKLEAAIKFSADTLDVDKLDVDIEAASSVTIGRLKADTIDVRMEAASKLKLAGECGRLIVNIGAASSVAASDLRCREATIDAGEASSVLVYASDKAVASAGVASSIRVSGNPRDFQKKSGLASSVALAN